MSERFEAARQKERGGTLFHISFTGRIYFVVTHCPWLEKSISFFCSLYCRYFHLVILVSRLNIWFNII